MPCLGSTGHTHSPTHNAIFWAWHWEYWSNGTLGAPASGDTQCGVSISYLVAGRASQAGCRRWRTLRTQGGRPPGEAFPTNGQHCTTLGVFVRGEPPSFRKSIFMKQQVPETSSKNDFEVNSPQSSEGLPRAGGCCWTPAQNHQLGWVLRGLGTANASPPPGGGNRPGPRAERGRETPASLPAGPSELQGTQFTGGKTTLEVQGGDSWHPQPGGNTVGTRG